MLTKMNNQKINAVARQLRSQLWNQLWNDESAQGATEYILLLAIVVGLAVAFGGKIKAIVNDKMSSISGAIDGFKPESGN